MKPARFVFLATVVAALMAGISACTKCRICSASMLYTTCTSPTDTFTMVFDGEIPFLDSARVYNTRGYQCSFKDYGMVPYKEFCDKEEMKIFLRDRYHTCRGAADVPEPWDSI